MQKHWVMKRMLLFCIFLICLTACKTLPDTVPVTSVTISQPTAEMIEGETVQLRAIVQPDNATDKAVMWASSKQSVATISENGLVTAISEGTSTITAIAGEKTGSCQVIVSKRVTAVSSISLNKEELDLIEGDSDLLVATVSPDNATDKTVIWITSDESIVTVDDSGKIKAIKEGKAIITAKAGGETAKCEVTVKKRIINVTSITLNHSFMSLVKGEEKVLAATFYPYNATNQTVIWSSSNTSVATVSSSGVVTGIAPSTAIITATTHDGGLTATCLVMVCDGKVNGQYYVDLGLPSGLKWATGNVGANSMEEYGDYFAWGEISPYYESQDPLVWKDGKSAGYIWASYKWCNGSYNTQTKYCTDSDYGTIDNKTVLVPDDDAAHANWGGSWRMPTAAEWTELQTACTWTWTTQNGVAGYLVSGPNGNSIFLPAAGHQNNTGLKYSGSDGYYWSSSLSTDSPCNAYFVQFNSGNDGGWGYFGRSSGFSVRPVSDEGVRVSVTGISFDKTSITLAIGKTTTITAAVAPSNATQKNVIWSSSDMSVAAVSYEGVVTAIAPGNARIMATTYDGGFTVTCFVTVKLDVTDPNGHAFVDLGLTSGLKWATCNVGATALTEYGDYFAWGETEPYYSSQNPLTWKRGKSKGYDWPSYQWCNGSYDTQTKYCTRSDYGTIDNKTVLDPEDDAAHANWGGTWRVPTDSEWTELRTECTWTWTTQNGVNGRLFTGPNGNSIFLPAAGYRYNTRLLDPGSSGYYWSSSLSTYNPPSALYVYFHSDDVLKNGDLRCRGVSVRPVTE